MNASKSTAETEEADSATNIERIHAQILHAKTRQRRLYLLAGFALIVCAVFFLGAITFSNGTVIVVHPKEVKDAAVLHVVGGWGAAIGNTAYSLRGNPTIEVSAAGFRPLRKTLLASETGGTVTIELSELPGQLHVETNPDSDKTRWFINGQMAVIAKALEKELFAGNYSLEIDNPYYKKKNISIVMQRDKTLDRSVDLQPVSGHLTINTMPSGANIQINGEQVGVSPLSLTKAGGAYRLEVAHGDYQSISETVEITNSESMIERDYRLALKKAFVHISLSPAGGLLLVNGKKVRLPAEKLAVKARMNNTLTYLKDGYFSQHRTISIAPGLEKNVSFRLKPEIGLVDIRSKPQATVVVDGRAMGQTPQALKLSALPHRVELRRTGYRSYKATVTPASKTTKKIRALLRTELQARLSETPKAFHNSVGIELKLFKPSGSFVMGAPRYEKGQRANEFLRTVKLTRPFYVGKYEVTVGQFASFRKRQGAQNEPIVSVSWIEAAEYCNWLSRREKLIPFYDIQHGQLRGYHVAADGYRLPSEAEWEWLARKASKRKQSKFTWGDDTIIPANAGNIADESAKGKSDHYVPNYSDGYAGIAPVGSYPAEKTGLYDLTGNVSEWVHDVYALVPPDGQKTEYDPLGASTGETHTVKGSNWRSGTITELRASFRQGAKAGRDDTGFRVARYVD